MEWSEYWVYESLIPSPFIDTRTNLSEYISLHKTIFCSSLHVRKMDLIIMDNNDDKTLVNVDFFHPTRGILLKVLLRRFIQ